MAMLAVTEALGSSLRIQNTSRSTASSERSRARRRTSLSSFGRPRGLPDWPFLNGIDYFPLDTGLLSKFPVYFTEPYTG